jgi:hypothetical protein
MSEHASSADKKVQLQLRFQASEDLRRLVGEYLILPDLRREFARRVFYLMLASPKPVEVAVDTSRISRIDPDMQETLRQYRNGIEDITSKVHMYVRPLRLAPELGYAAQEGISASLRFRLALSRVETDYLLARPFDQVPPEKVYVASQLRDEVLIPPEERADALYAMRMDLGVYSVNAQRLGRALDHQYHYYVDRPSVQSRHIDLNEV